MLKFLALRAFIFFWCNCVGDEERRVASVPADVVDELLVSSRELKSKTATVKTLKKIGMKIGTLKSLLLMGIV